MIGGPHLDQGQGVLEPLRNAQVRLARLCDPGGVVVREDTGGRVMADRRADDLARVDARPVDGAPEQLLEGEDAVAVVEPDHREDFVGLRREAHPQQLLRQLRRREGRRPAPETPVQLRLRGPKDLVPGGHPVAAVFFLHHQRAEVTFCSQNAFLTLTAACATRRLRINGR